MHAADAHREFLMWGAILTVGYLLSAWSALDVADIPRPGEQTVAGVWLVMFVLAILGHRVLHRSEQPRRSSALSRRLLKMNAVLLIAAVVGSEAIPAPSGVNAYWPLALGLIYIVNGVFVGPALYLIGGWFIAAGTVSTFMPDWVQATWLAFATGGGLAITGFALRRNLRSDADPA